MASVYRENPQYNVVCPLLKCFYCSASAAWNNSLPSDLHNFAIYV